MNDKMKDAARHIREVNEAEDSREMPALLCTVVLVSNKGKVTLEAQHRPIEGTSFAQRNLL